MDLVLILLLALAIDLSIGEYPVVLHPTVWAGRLVEALIKPGFKLKPGLQFIYGILISLATITLFTLPVWLLLGWLHGINYWLYIGIGAIILKPTLCFKQQWQVAEKARATLELKTQVPSKMKELFNTVSHTDTITREDVISSSIRSLAENASDFVTAPLFYYIFLGVPGAIAYRVINTLDNMIGYRGKFEYLGKFAARLDDIASFIPSRTTAFLFVLGAKLSRLNADCAWRTMLGDHGKTPGPNGGWPMAATAGALGVRLLKVGHYEIGQPTRTLSSNHIGEAVNLYRASMTIWIVFSALALMTIALL